MHGVTRIHSRAGDDGCCLSFWEEKYTVGAHSVPANIVTRVIATVPVARNSRKPPAYRRAGSIREPARGSNMLKTVLSQALNAF